MFVKDERSMCDVNAYKGMKPVAGVKQFVGGEDNILYDLTDLCVFLAVAEAGNLSPGAQRCHLSPSSVILRIKDLEEAVGTMLLMRQARA